MSKDRWRIWGPLDDVDFADPPAVVEFSYSIYGTGPIRIVGPVGLSLGDLWPVSTTSLGDLQTDGTISAHIVWEI